MSPGIGSSWRTAIAGAAAALAGCGALWALLRLRGCRSRREAVSFLLILLSSVLAGLAPNRDPPAGLLALAVLWSVGWHSGIVEPPSRLAPFSLAVGLLALLPALAAGLGLQGLSLIHI